MLSEGVAVADLFLDDAIIASTKGRKEAEEVYFNAEDGDILNGRPIVVLIDGDTASAAEVLAAALQEQDRAKVIGTNSLGKGSIQTLVSLSDGATIALTSAYFYTPSGSRLHGHGVLPDVCTFEMPEAKNIRIFWLCRVISFARERAVPTRDWIWTLRGKCWRQS